MDAFRQKQKKFCHRNGTYGCPCCRFTSDLNKFKKITRKIARHILRFEDRKAFRDHLGTI